jgi:ribonucleoside-diphosphate reductase alpha chain
MVGRSEDGREAGSRNPAASIVTRRFSKAGADPVDAVEMETRRSVITNPDGSVVFEMNDVEVPKAWSQLATDIVASKYFRKAGVPVPGGREHSVRQLVHRIVKTIRMAGEELGGYFADRDEAQAFESELAALLVSQRGAFNSPVWFNCGLHHEYSIAGSGGNFAWNPDTDHVEEVEDAYSRPQCSACFIQSVDDDLMSIFSLAKNEARLFKYGSGTGTNFSKLRGRQEKLSGGGTSSGLMSFLEVLDRAAGATKSGGTTRRAAKMVCLDMDHPEIVDFIEWKSREEKKARALIEAGYPSDFNGDAYRTVSGQNSNNSVRVTDEFMKAVDEDGPWRTRFVTSGAVGDTYRARDLMEKIARAAWECADPGMQFDTTINRWHTCKETGRINASNPCSEYMFLDDSACNLASLNLVQFLDDEGNFDIDGYRHAIRVFITAMEILVDLSSYPTERIAQNSHDYRPLGLGYANLGSLLMILGVPYDSEEGRAIAGALTAILTGHAYRVSAEIASKKGPFPGWRENAKSMADVMRMHRAAVDDIAPGCPLRLLEAARADWDDAVRFGDAYGYRNAQATVLAPTGTIGLLMDCDTTGIEPDFSLVKFKKLAGGGYFKIVNQSVARALRGLGYTESQIEDIDRYVRGTMTLENGPGIDRVRLREKGFTEEDLKKVEAALPGAFSLEGAVTPWTLGEAAMTRLSIPKARWSQPGFSLLRELGFTKSVIEHASDVICGRMTVEGAPHLLDVHLPIFDCANRCGRDGKRFIEPMGHVRMMAAAQPFISGAISKTVNLPAEMSALDIEDLYRKSWALGLKAVAIYRDGSKQSQPLSSSGESEGKADKKDREKGAKSAVPFPAEKVSEPVVASSILSTMEMRAAIESAGPAAVTRVRLPRKRGGFTQEARVGGQKIYLRTGEYEDGRLGEIFIDMHKEGAAFRSMMNCFAIAVSLGLQYGVPLDEYVDCFTFTRFDPHGHTDHPNVRFSTSIVDYVFRVLAMEYLGRHDMVQVPPQVTMAAAVDAAADEAAAEAAEEEAAAHEAAEETVEDPRAGDAKRAPAALVKVVDAPVTHGAGSGNGNGNGNGHAAGVVRETRWSQTVKTQGFTEQLTMVMKDAPFCDTCGHLTVRNGACYKCLNCGQSVGCS